ncbi:MAG: hypothetical protein ACRCT1_02790 [Microcoleaceae cyanobacterium]
MLLAGVQSSVLLNIQELIGMAAAIASAAFFIANLKLKETTDRNLLLLTQRLQRVSDVQKVKSALLSQRMLDIEGFLTKQGFSIRAEFPSDALPSENNNNSDFSS